jgi:hypothetical protein
VDFHTSLIFRSFSALRNPQLNASLCALGMAGNRFMPSEAIRSPPIRQLARSSVVMTNPGVGFRRLPQLCAKMENMGIIGKIILV